MFRRRFETIWPIAIVVAVLVLLPAIAVYQYHWIGRVSETEHDRMQALVQSAAAGLAGDFDEPITRVYASIQGRGFRRRLGGGAPQRRDRPGLEEYGRRYLEWSQSTPHPRLVRAFWAIRRNEQNQLELLRFDHEKEDFVPSSWPPELESLHAALGRSQEDPPQMLAGALDEGAPLLLAPLGRGPFGGFRAPPPPPGEPGEPRAQRRPEQRWPDEWTVLELDRAYLCDTLLPALAQRHFASSGFGDYDLEVVRKDEPSKVLYHWVLPTPPPPGSPADVRVSMLAVRPEFMFGARQAAADDGRPAPRMSDRGRWEMLVRHRSGSLETVVGQARRRNLAISSVVLLLIGATMLALALATHRARQLAREQVEFAAGVSHELRTPLTVIRSAADNLADGLVNDPKQVRKYGALIGSEGRRLSDMVDEILAFTGWRSGRATHEMKDVDVPAMLERAVAAAEPDIRTARCELERRFDPALPRVNGDETALVHCFRNLLSNAAKHAGSGCWIGLRAEPAPDGRSVRVSVEDHGAGIDSAEIPHLFEPFYRGRRAKEDQIHGAGLGLSLVKRIADAHGGSVQVTSVPDSGSVFTVTLPAAPNHKNGSPKAG